MMCDLGIEDEVDVQEDDKGSPLLESETLDDMKQLKDHKAEGGDGIPVEFWKNVGEELTKELVELYQEI